LRQRHVVVLYQHRLFGEAIARILGEIETVRVDVRSIGSLSPEALAAMQCDAIVLEQAAADGDAKACLLDAPPVLTFVLGSDSNTVEVYERYEVIQATAAAIVARIVDGPRRAPVKRVAAGRRDVAL